MSKYKFGKNNDKEQSDWVRIAFYGLDKNQMEHLHKAESELGKAGVTFGTGYDFEEKRRDWEFDWSLKGARVQVKEAKA